MTAYLDCADDLAALVPDGAMIAVAKAPLAPFALARALIRRGARDLHLVTVPTAGMVADLLIGAGVVGTVETSGVSLGEFGPAPRFAKAVKSGAIRIKDATCPAVYAALQAAEKGQPFAPIRGVLGSDVLANRPDWKVIDNPFAEGEDPVVLLAPIRPDFALIHADRADRFGNVFVGGRHEYKTMAHAAGRTLVTVEEIVDHDLREEPATAANLIGGIYVAALAEAKGGARPEAAPGRYAADEAAIVAYARLARDDAAFADYLAAEALGPVRAAAE
ncbi:CoA transferase subunit A [Pikeienuella sp. HZG-20]|uniref:CoA transferase subunit A n=1 Tax=Paludibacillus litoralis TaxID=3133267 RepID=UPI0030EEF6B3